MAQLNQSALPGLIEAHKKGVVVGLKDVAGVVSRLDIDVLLHDYPKTFNLYILAMDELQTKSDVDDLMGYFQIAGRVAHVCFVEINAHQLRTARRSQNSLGWDGHQV